MKIRILGLILGGAATIAAPAIVTGCSQAKAPCIVEHASSGLPYIVLYKPKGTVDPMSACGTKTGELLGMETYHGVVGTDSRDLTINRVAIQTGEFLNTLPTYDCFSADDAPPPDGSGYKAAGDYHDADATHTVYALGDFASDTPTDDFCTLKAPIVAQQSFPKIPATTVPANPTPTCLGLATICDMMTKDDCCDVDVGQQCADACAAADPMDPMCMKQPCMDCLAACPPVGTPDPATCHTTEIPATNVQYEWSNLNIYVTAAAPGTQFTGTLKYTVDSCTAEYDVIAMWPAVNCTMANAAGDPILDGMMNPQPDINLCSPDADTDTADKCNAACTASTSDPSCANMPCQDCQAKCAAPRATGSGINPDFATKCVDIDGTKNFYCVLDTNEFKVPVLKAAQ